MLRLSSTTTRFCCIVAPTCFSSAHGASNGTFTKRLFDGSNNVNELQQLRYYGNSTASSSFTSIYNNNNSNSSESVDSAAATALLNYIEDNNNKPNTNTTSNFDNFDSKNNNENNDNNNNDNNDNSKALPSSSSAPIPKNNLELVRKRIMSEATLVFQVLRETLGAQEKAQAHANNNKHTTNVLASSTRRSGATDNNNNETIQQQTTSSHFTPVPSDFEWSFAYGETLYKPTPAELLHFKQICEFILNSSFSVCPLPCALHITPCTLTNTKNNVNY